MTSPIIFCGDSIDQGSKPTFIFPLLASSLHVDLTMRDPFNLINDLVLTESGFISATFPATGTGIHLTGTDSAGVVDVADYPTSLAGLNMRYRRAGTLEGRAICDPIPTEEAIAGQLANLGVKYSQGGNALIPAIGVLAEIGEGLYKYTLDSTETQQPGTNLIRIQPVNSSCRPQPHGSSISILAIVWPSQVSL